MSVAYSWVYITSCNYSVNRRIDTDIRKLKHGCSQTHSFRCYSLSIVFLCNSCQVTARSYNNLAEVGTNQNLRSSWSTVFARLFAKPWIRVSDRFGTNPNICLMNWIDMVGCLCMFMYVFIIIYIYIYIYTYPIVFHSYAINGWL